jgi:hypothetical protein
MRLDGKVQAVSSLDCDVMVIPESAETTVLSQDSGVSWAWQGLSPKKGLGVFAFNGWTVTPHPTVGAADWLLPLTVSDPTGADVCSLLAMWTVKRSGDGRPSYAAQLAQVIDANRELLEQGRVLIAGDLNASPQGPSAAPHAVNVQTLSGLGVESVYHAHTGSEHGAEQQMTLRWVGPGKTRYEYHCDFIFASRLMLDELRSVSIGPMNQWVESGLSDHCPVIADFTQ